MQVRHGLVHAKHHPLIAVHPSRFPAGSIMVVKIRCHILPDYGGISPVHEIFEVLSDKLFHLLWGKRGCHVSTPEATMGSESPLQPPPVQGQEIPVEHSSWPADLEVRTILLARCRRPGRN